MGEKPKVTASEIKLALAAKHRGGRDYFLTEVKSGSTWVGSNLRRLDAVAVRKSWAQPHITGYEVKVSRSDFTGDAKFYTYLQLVHALYIVTPKGMVQREEVPLEIGLIWYDPEKKSLTTKKKPPPREIEISVDMLLYIIYRRLEPERIPFYSSKAEYFRAWLDNKRAYRELGYEVKGKLVSEIERLEAELRKADRFERGGHMRKEYEAIVKTMRDNGLPEYGDPIRWLRERLNKCYPVALDEIHAQAAAIVRAVEREKARAEQEQKESEQ